MSPVQTGLGVGERINIYEYLISSGGKNLNESYRLLENYHIDEPSINIIGLLNYCIIALKSSFFLKNTIRKSFVYFVVFIVDVNFSGSFVSGGFRFFLFAAKAFWKIKFPNFKTKGHL